MEAFLSDTVKAILLALIAIAIVLGWSARRFRRVGWLQVFRPPAGKLSAEQRAAARGSGNRQAALEILLAGLALPVLYIASTVMLFHGFETTATVVVAASSIACIVAGLWIFTRNRER